MRLHVELSLSMSSLIFLCFFPGIKSYCILHTLTSYKFKIGWHFDYKYFSCLYITFETRTNIRFVGKNAFWHATVSWGSYIQLISLISY